MNLNNIPGTEFVDSYLGSTVMCKHHGMRYTPGELHIGDKVYAICLDCFDAVCDRDKLLKAPLSADLLCNDGFCNLRAGDNFCKICQHRYCTRHMWEAGPFGLCKACMKEEPEEPAPNIEAVKGLSSCAHDDKCKYLGITYCNMCQRFYCDIHMSPNVDGVCRICSGEDDDDISEN